INSYASNEPRIRAQFLKSNLGISLNSNAAIEHSSGKYIAFLDHDDLLAPNALYEIAKCLNQKRDVDFIYSDCDRITMEDKRTDPLFKPAWSPETMLCVN